MNKWQTYFSGKNAFVFITVLFVLICTIFIVNGYFIFALLPIAIGLVYWALVAADSFLLFIVFSVPLSVPLEKFWPSFGFNIQLPTELLIVFLLALFILKFFKNETFNRKIAIHPISISIYVYLFWMFITSISSSIPIVSFKYLASRIWFILVFYFLATSLFKHKKNIRRYFWIYISGFLIVVLIVIFRMLQKGIFNQFVAQFSTYPFFPDHTSYGAIIAMLLPFTVSFLFYKKLQQKTLFWVFLVVVLFCIALVMSYTRAAWISVFVALIVFLLIYFRVSILYVAITIIISIGAIYINRTEIVLSLEQNQQDSSKDLKKHLQSVYNIRNDASNLERINRWKSALRMFKERPVLGWGPGTYMFKYAPFQASHDKTYISTNRGDWGNAHSEFIGPLAESGLLGTLTFVILLVMVFTRGIKLYYLSKKNSLVKVALIGAVLGLATYVTHGFLNNFLDTDKASALFWGYIAIIVSADIYHQKKVNPKLQN